MNLITKAVHLMALTEMGNCQIHNYYVEVTLEESFLLDQAQHPLTKQRQVVFNPLTPELMELSP